MDERIIERKTTIMWKGARCLPLEVGVAERIILSRKEGLSLSGWRARTRGSWHSRSAREEDTFKWYFNTRTRGKVYLRWREAATHAWKPRQRCQSDRSKRWENWRTYSWRITVLEESQPTVKEAEDALRARQRRGWEHRGDCDTPRLVWRSIMFINRLVWFTFNEDPQCSVRSLLCATELGCKLVGVKGCTLLRIKSIPFHFMVCLRTRFGVRNLFYSPRVWIDKKW